MAAAPGNEVAIKAWTVLDFTTSSPVTIEKKVAVLFNGAQGSRDHWFRCAPQRRVVRIDGWSA